MIGGSEEDLNCLTCLYPDKMSTIKVKEVAFSGYPVTDIPRARSFYEGLFHFTPSLVFEHGDKAWIEYDIGTTTFAISNYSPDWKPHKDGPSIAFEVESFEEAMAALRSWQVRFYLEPMDSGACQMAVVADPDGNSVIVHQRKPTQAAS